MCSRKYIIRFLLLGLFLLVLLIGCAPSIGGETTVPAPTEQPTQPVEPTATITELTPTPTSTIAVLPPALVDVQPGPYSSLGLDEPITFYFNQAMDRQSFQDSFIISPKLTGDFTWVDEATVQFVPDGQYPPTTSFTFTIRESARAANGLALLNPIDLNFTSVDYLRISEQIPEAGLENVNTDSAVMITFNQPVNHQGKAGFFISPEIEGKGEWDNDSVYIFYPDSPGLLASTRYAVMINPELVSQGGAKLAPNYLDQDAIWSFTTDSPRLLSVQPEDGSSIAAYQTFVLTFNQPMDTFSVETNLSLQTAKGKVVEAEYIWNASGNQVSVKPLAAIDPEAEYNLVLLGLAANQNGVALKDNYAFGYTSYPELILQQDLVDTVELSYDGEGSFIIDFNSPLAEGQNLVGLIDFSPVVKNISATLDESDPSIMVVRGVFKAVGIYYLGISADLTDAYGRRLGSNIYLSFKTSKLPAILVYPLESAGFEAPISDAEGLPPVFIPLDDPTIQAITTNIRTLNMSSSHLTVEQFIQMAGSANQDRLNSPLENITTWTQTVPQYMANTQMQLEIPFAPPRKTPSTGFYSLVATSDDLPGESGYVPQPILAVISQVVVFVKTDANQIIAWAYNMNTDEPVQKAPVIAYNSLGEILGGGTTDSTGMVKIDLADQTGLTGTIYTVVWKPGHPDFGVSYTGWSLNGLGWEQYHSIVTPEEQVVAQLYTDRLQYTAGQMVNFNAIVRKKVNGSYKVDTSIQPTVNVLEEPEEGETEWRVLASIPLELSAYGTASGSYQVPAGVTSGEYKLQITDTQAPGAPGSSVEVVFYVESSAQYQLAATFLSEDYILGDSIKANITSTSSSGLPAASKNITWKLYASPVKAVMTNGDVIGKQQIQLKPDSENDDSVLLLEGSAITDKGGFAELTFSMEEIENPIDLELTNKLTLVAVLENHADSQVIVSTILHPADYVISIHPESWGTQVAEELGYTIQTLDWNGNPSSQHKISAQFRKVIWTVTDKVDETTGLGLYETSYVQVGSTDFETDSNGQARLVFSPSEPGVYQLRTAGDGTVSEVYAWVGGIGNAAWVSFPNQTILLAANSTQYQVGDTAQIFIPNPFSGITTALITVENETILKSEVVSFEGSNYIYNLDITGSYSPDVYISVLMYGRQYEDQPEFRQGIIELPVDDQDKWLDLSMNLLTDPIIPGQDVTLQLQARDNQGRPVQGNFSVAVLEELDQLNPFVDIQSLASGFYGSRTSGVFSNNSLAGYLRGGLLAIGGSKLDEDPLGYLGVWKPVAGLNNISSTSQETLLWLTDLETDKNGIVDIVVTLPNKPGIWLVDVRGCTLETACGDIQFHLDAHNAVQVDLYAPDDVHEGDHIQITGIARNLTEAETTFQVSLEGDTITFDQPELLTQTVTLAAGGQDKIIWWGVVGDASTLKLAMSVQSMDQLYQNQTQKVVSVDQSLVKVGYSFSGAMTVGETQEVFGIPQSVIDMKGVWKLVISPSIPSIMLDLTQQLQTSSAKEDQLEASVSLLLSLVELVDMYRSKGLTTEAMSEDVITRHLDRLESRILAIQNSDGGWGLHTRSESDPYLTALAFYGLTRLDQLDGGVDTYVLQKSQAYLLNSMPGVAEVSQSWQYDLLAFEYYVLSVAKQPVSEAADLVSHSDEMSSWAKAFLALALETADPGNLSSQDLASGLINSIQTGNTGIYWEDLVPANGKDLLFYRMISTKVDTAIVLSTLSQLGVQDTLYTEGISYLLSQRSWASGDNSENWMDSYETCWTILALGNILKTDYGSQLLSTGEFQVSAGINGISLLDQTSTGNRTDLIEITFPIDQLDRNLNSFILKNTATAGFIYYRGEIDVKATVWQSAPAYRGVSITRTYLVAGEDCGKASCAVVEELQVGNGTTPYLVRLDLVVDQDAYNVVIEDKAPSGVKMYLTSLASEDGNRVLFDPTNPLKMGWGGWLFTSSRLSSNMISWYAEVLPAGSYTLYYQVIPGYAGEFLVEPVRIWEYYTPEIGGNTATDVLKITP